ncbi:MAG: hypothetical protein ACK5KM_03340 [Hyphomicrobiaceae bacterium]
MRGNVWARTRTSALISLVPACIFVTMAMTSAVHGEPQAKHTKRIYTGGDKGAYHLSFCPPLATALEKAGQTYTCTPSAGSLDNMKRVAASPRDIGFAQLDVLTLNRQEFSDGQAFSTIRSGDVHECLFAVTRNPELKSFGDIAARAEELRFILPSEDSGSSGTFRYLQSIDMDLAHATSVRHTENVDEAIRLALSADDTVSLFIQFPDPDNPRFQLVNRLGGHFIPVIDRNILSASIEGRSIYFAKETEVMDARWTKQGKQVITACTPLVIFTGAARHITNPEAAKAHAAMIKEIREIPADKLKPSDDLLASVVKRTKELSAAAVGKLVDVSEAARDKTKPLLEKAQEATSKALEGSKPHVEKSKKTGQETLKKAQETVKDLIEPSHAPAKAGEAH